MTDENREVFRRIFNTELKNLIFSDKVLREDFQISTDERFDETDQASWDVEQSMRLRLRSRESLYVKKITEALKRIEQGTFGECESCGEEIELRRLEARPTATLCVSCKEEQERKEGLTVSGRMSKSVGVGLSTSMGMGSLNTSG